MNIELLRHQLNDYLYPHWIKEFKKNWKDDLISGISVSLVAIPQSMAYASIAGLPAYYGLYAGFIPTILAAFFGSSKYASVGPVAIVSLLTFSALKEIPNLSPAEFAAFASVLALLVGIIQIILGIAKLGTLIKYVAHPVFVGFTNAAALIIGITQIPKLFGLNPISNAHFFESLVQIFGNFTHIELATSVFGISSLLFIALNRRFNPKFPVILVLVVISIFWSWQFGFKGEIVGHIPRGLPSLNLKLPQAYQLDVLLQSAIIIAVVGYMEGISIAKTLAQKAHDQLNPNKEIAALGISNISASLVSAFPVAGSFSRTVLNYTSGAKSNFSSLIVGFATLATLLFFTPFLYYLPQTVLAAIIINAVSHIIDLKSIHSLLKTHRNDAVVALITFSSTLLFAPHLDYGIIIGVVASIFSHLYTVSHPNITILDIKKPTIEEKKYYKFRSYPTNNKVLVVLVDWDLFFANISSLEDSILEAISGKKQIKYVLLLGRGISYIDSSAEEVLSNITLELRERNIKLMVSSLQPKVMENIKNTSLYQEIGPENFFVKANQALKYISQK